MNYPEKVRLVGNFCTELTDEQRNAFHEFCHTVSGFKQLHMLEAEYTALSMTLTNQGVSANSTLEALKQLRSQIFDLQYKLYQVTKEWVAQNIKPEDQ